MSLKKPNRAPSCLPLRFPRPSPFRTHQRIIIAHHLVLTGYGHWVGTTSEAAGRMTSATTRCATWAPIHKGRKRNQPSREELRAFYREVKSRLAFIPVWYDEAKRQAIADAFAQVAAEMRYTVWACAVLRNHAHLVVRRPSRRWAGDVAPFRARRSTRRSQVRRIPDEHPVWSGRPYKVFPVRS